MTFINAVYIYSLLQLVYTHSIYAVTANSISIMMYHRSPVMLSLIATISLKE